MSALSLTLLDSFIQQMFPGNPLCLGPILGPKDTETTLSLKGLTVQRGQAEISPDSDNQRNLSWKEEAWAKGNKALRGQG